MSEQTWDTLSAEPVVPADAGTTPEAEAIQEGEPPALEAETPQLETVDAVRESESPVEVTPTEEPKSEEDEDVEEGDTPEILALPSKSSSRKWARRQYKDAAPVRTFLGNAPVSQFDEDLKKLSITRHREHVDDIADGYRDYISQRLFNVPHAEVLRRLTGEHAQPANTPTQPLTVEPTGALFTDQDLDQLPWEHAERIREYQSQQSEKERRMQAQNEALQKRLEAIEGKVTTTEQAEQQRAQQAREAKAVEIANDLYTSVWTVLDEGIRDSGLEISKDDPPRIQNLKKNAAKILRLETQPTFFGQDEEKRLGDQAIENQNLVNTVVAAADRLERENAFREEHNLKVRGRAAFEAVKATPEVQEILNEIESYAKSRSHTRDIPPPPVPGASAGMTIKPAGTWDELQAQVASR